MSERLFPYALFGGLLAMAGLPIYIHAPKFYVDSYGVSLAALGAVLFGLRLLDVVQDPVLGWLSRRVSDQRGLAVAIAALIMAGSMVGLFAVTPPFAPLVWLALMLAGLFSAFSFLTISFYAQGVSKARRLPGDGHVRLAGWRETGALVGVALASVLPVVLLGVTSAPFALFAVLFAGLALLAVLAMRAEWGTDRVETPGLRPVLADPLARRLLLIGLLNAAPVAVSSTLFLFFVESRLAAPGWEGPLLLLFFLAAAASAPIWSRMAEARGTKGTLMLGMVLAIAAFGWAATLGAGDAAGFAVICVVSGAALGADMTLLPALFARRMAEVVPEAAEGFGLWSFVTKFSLAFAAVVLLPLLEASGFQAGAVAQSDDALWTLTISYAVLPCVLKLGALAVLFLTPLDGMGRTAITGGTS